MEAGEASRRRSAPAEHPLPAWEGSNESPRRALPDAITRGIGSPGTEDQPASRLVFMYEHTCFLAPEGRVEFLSERE